MAGDDQSLRFRRRILKQGSSLFQLRGGKPAARGQVWPSRIETENGRSIVKPAKPRITPAGREFAEISLERASAMRSPCIAIMIAWNHGRLVGVFQQSVEPVTSLPKFGGQGGGGQVAGDQDVVRAQTPHAVDDGLQPFEAEFPGSAGGQAQHAEGALPPEKVRPNVESPDVNIRKMNDSQNRRASLDQGPQGNQPTNRS